MSLNLFAEPRNDSLDEFELFGTENEPELAFISVTCACELKLNLKNKKQTQYKRYTLLN